MLSPRLVCCKMCTRKYQFPTITRTDIAQFQNLNQKMSGVIRTENGSPRLAYARSHLLSAYLHPPAERFYGLTLYSG
jgi:hypothetical protein